MSRGRPAPQRDANGLKAVLAVAVAAVLWNWPVPAAIALIVGYAGICKFWPVTTCGKCGGSGKCFAPLSNRMHRTCPRCDGKGVHVRLGAAIWHSGDE